MLLLLSQKADRNKPVSFIGPKDMEGDASYRRPRSGRSEGTSTGGSLIASHEPVIPNAAVQILTQIGGPQQSLVAMSGREMIAICQQAVQDERAFAQEEMGTLSAIRDQIGNLRASIPFSSLQVKEWEWKIDQFRSGECTIAEVLDSSATIGKASSILKEKKAPIERLLRIFAENPTHLAECLADVFLQQKRPSHALRKEVSDLAKTVIFGIFGQSFGSPYEGKLLVFLKHVIYRVMSGVEQPQDIYDNAFLRKIASIYARRVGRCYLTAVLREPISQVVLRDEFDVQLSRERVVEVLREQVQQDRMLNHMLTGPHHHAHGNGGNEKSQKIPSTPSRSAGSGSSVGSSSSSSSLLSASSSSSSSSTLSSSSSSSIFSPGVGSGSIKTADGLSIKDVSQSEDDVVKRMLTKNQANLYEICTKIIGNLLQSASAIPYGIRFICREIVNAAKMKFGDEQGPKVHAAIQDFIFPHFLNLAIVDPSRFGVVVDHPVRDYAREKLSVVANVLRHTAFALPFPENSPYASMNIFVQQNSDAMARFFRSISLVESVEGMVEPQLPCPLPIVVSLNELVTLHRVVLRNVSSLSDDETFSTIRDIGPPLPFVAEEENRHMCLNEVELPPEAAPTFPVRDGAMKLACDRLESLLVSLPKNIHLRAEKDVVKLLEVQAQIAHSEKNLLLCCAIVDVCETLKQLPPFLMDSQFRQCFESILQHSQTRRQILAVHASQAKLNLLRYTEALTQFSEMLDKERQHLFQFIHMQRTFPYLVDNWFEVRKLVADLARNSQLDDQRKKIQAFLDAHYGGLRSYLMQSRATSTELDSASTILERFVFSRIHDNTFQPYVDAERERDKALFLKLSSVSSVEPDHLEIPRKFHMKRAWSTIVEELQRLLHVRLAHDKLSLVVRCCKSLYDLMKIAGSDQLPAADDFLPVLIFVLIKANPPQLGSNMAAMSSYLALLMEDSRGFVISKRVDHDQEYWFRHFEAAVMYVVDLNPIELQRAIAESRETRRRSNELERATAAGACSMTAAVSSSSSSSLVSAASPPLAVPAVLAPEAGSAISLSAPSTVASTAEGEKPGKASGDDAGGSALSPAARVLEGSSGPAEEVAAVATSCSTAARDPNTLQVMTSADAVERQPDVVAKHRRSSNMAAMRVRAYSRQVSSAHMLGYGSTAEALQHHMLHGSGSAAPGSVPGPSSTSSSGSSGFSGSPVGASPSGRLSMHGPVALAPAHATIISSPMPSLSSPPMSGRSGLLSPTIVGTGGAAVGPSGSSGSAGAVGAMLGTDGDLSVSMSLIACAPTTMIAAEVAAASGGGGNSATVRSSSPVASPRTLSSGRESSSSPVDHRQAAVTSLGASSGSDELLLPFRSRLRQLVNPKFMEAHLTEMRIPEVAELLADYQRLAAEVMSHGPSVAISPPMSAEENLV